MSQHFRAKIFRAAALSASVAMAACVSPAPITPLPRLGEIWAGRDLGGGELAAFAKSLREKGLPGGETFSPGDGIELSEGVTIALFFNPRLRAERAQAGVAESAARFAGLWDDPRLGVDFLRILESAAEPWVAGAQLALTLPVAGRRGAEKRAADAHAEAERRRILGLEGDLVRDTRAAWLAWSAADLKLAQGQDELERIEEIAAVAQRLAQADEIKRTEARVFAIEAANRRADLAMIEADARERASALKSLMGLDPRAPIDLRPTMSIGLQDPPPDEGLRRRLEANNARLHAKRAECDEADAAARRELRGRWPELEIGPAGEREEGINKIGAAAALTLPLWNRNRRAIAEALAAREAARADYAAEMESLAGDLARAQERHASARAALRELDRSLIPLVEEQLREARSLAELGDFDALLLRDALAAARGARERIIEQTLAQETARAEIEALCPATESEAPEEQGHAE